MVLDYYGELRENKTSRFLAPLLQLHGQQFIDRCIGLFILGFFIDDKRFKDMGYKMPIYIVFDSAVNKPEFEQFLLYIREQPFYLNDYPYHIRKKGTRREVVVISLPESCVEIYEHFLQGNYSKMFEGRMQLSIAKDLLYPRDYNIVVKNSQGREELKKEIEEMLGVYFIETANYKEYCLSPEIELQKEIIE